MRSLLTAVVLALTALLSGCCPGCGGPAQLIVDVRTDLVLGEEADEIALELDGEEVSRISAVGLTALADPVRLEPVSVAPGEHRVGVRLLSMGTAVLSRAVQVRVTEVTVVPIWLVRTCANVTCPGTGATECEDGRCVEPTCIPSELGGCGEIEPCPTGECTIVPPACEEDIECPTPPDPCAVGVCSDGRCLAVGDPDACLEDQYCDPELGCSMRTVPAPVEAEPPVQFPPDAGTVPQVTCCDQICEVGGVATRCCR